MSEKRRDNRNRILHEGETQRKDGSYLYKYKDIDGTPRYVYSWRLDKNDRTPDGKRRDLSLREKERQVQANLFNQVSCSGSNMTVLDLVEKYVSTKVGVRNSTRAGYQTTINFLKKDPFGKMKISQIKLYDAKYWLVKLQQKDGKSYSAIHSIRGVLRPAFRMALDDDLISKNPFEFELANVIVNDSVIREAITKAQQRKLLQFIQADQHFSRYYDGIFILFHTGLRISEFAGLTVSDIDFTEHKLIVDHQLQRTSQMQYMIEETKTKSGNRTLPMSKEVEACFRRIIDTRRVPVQEPVVDGRSGFLYLDKNDMPMVAMHWEKYFQHIIEKYNKIYKEEMPEVTPHICRHTYCTNMARTGMNPKTLQYLMGHSDISITLNYYTHLKYEDAKEELEQMKKES